MAAQQLKAFVTGTAAEVWEHALLPGADPTDDR